MVSAWRAAVKDAVMTGTPGNTATRLLNSLKGGAAGPRSHPW